MESLLITGASRGIGRAIACKLAAKGMTLLLHGRDATALGETTRLSEQAGARTVSLLCDLGASHGVEALIAQIGDQVIDLLVNNAGIAVAKPFAEISLSEWQQIFAINVTAPFLLTQHFAPRMRLGSAIVNILSIAAKSAFPNWSAYCASKFALEGFSAAVREELRTRLIRVINIYPAATDTDIWQNVAGNWPREKMLSAESVANAVAYAVNQPPAIAIENITLGNTSGTL